MDRAKVALEPNVRKKGKGMTIGNISIEPA
jgi:hypothetical protein